MEDKTDPPKDTSADSGQSKDETFWEKLAKVKRPPKRPTQSGFIGTGFLFSLFVAMLLAAQSINISYSRGKDGEELTIKTQTPDILWLIVCTPLIGLGLGVEVDKTEIGKAMAEVARRLLGNGEQK